MEYIKKGQGGEKYPTNNKKKEGSWLSDTSFRNCFLKHVIEKKIDGRIAVTVRRGRRRKQLLDDVKEKRG
jgi:hypothetical protein